VAFNTQGGIAVPLTVFGSLCTEMAAPDLPEGVSPDNADVVFVPGSVASRPAFQKVFGTPFAGPPLWAKSYVNQTSTYNLYLDSTGIIWVENVIATPGVYTQLAKTTPGSYAKSITAFGREYIAISDGLHGTDSPLQWDGTNLDRVTQDGPGAPPSIANLIIAESNISSLARAANVVTVVTATSHGLKVGYQAQISGAANQLIGALTSVVINNEQQPGIATVTMGSAHGLVPGNFVTISGIYAAPVGTAITNLYRESQVTKVVTSTAHGLQPGATIQILGATTGFNGTWTVDAVIDALNFTIVQVGADATGTGGTLSLLWPIPDVAADELYEVISAPTADTFQIAISYNDGTWTTGNVYFTWNGTFFVQSVISATSFTYQQYGPNGTAGASGMVTPYGQAAPGIHQMQVLFLTRQGYTTRPSPPVQFIANGGQYLSVTNIPIGPPNVVARILAFTGAGGDLFFYLPVSAQVNGQVVSTPTQINDNTTTSATLDFSDNSLFAALGISISGNNLASQIILDGALGFGFYGSRLVCWGQRNQIQNLLNMGFNGGYLPSASTLPSGWTAAGGGAGGTLSPGISLGSGYSWSVTGAGSIYQSFFQDAYGAPIGTPNTKYRARAFVQGGTITVTISSVSASFTSTATLAGNASGQWAEAAFTQAMPNTIPTDMILSISGTAGTSVDNISIIYAQTPYLETVLFGSYVDNPEGFDGLSGKFGPTDDTRKVMDVGIIRNTFYLVTQDPSGRLHATNDNGVTEPSGWTISQVGANCGVLSAFGLTHSQADDFSAGGGEEWFAWPSASGIRIFGGDQPWKISQENQPIWDSINLAAAKTIWGLNDPVSRVMYFGLPLPRDHGDDNVPTKVYVLNYRELDTPYQIFSAAPYHPSFAGHLIATDNTRKSTLWNRPMNGAAMMYRAPGQLSPVFLGGSFQNVYTLNPAKFTDDDYGLIAPYYTTYFFVNAIQESGLRNEKGEPLGAYRKILAYLTAFVAGVGNVTITAFPDSLTNPWPLTCTRTLAANPTYDLEWAGGNVIGQRIAIRVASTPLQGQTDNAFNLQKLMCVMRAQRHLPIRGAA